MRKAILMLLAVASLNAVAVTGEEAPQAHEPRIESGGSPPSDVIGKNTKWTWAGGNSSAQAYAALSTIRHDGDKAIMWILLDIETAELAKELADNRFLSSAFRAEFNCKRKLFRLTDGIAFSENMGNGKAVAVVPNLEWSNSSFLGPMMGAYLTIACGKGSVPKRRFDG